MNLKRTYKKLHIWRLKHISEQTYLLLLSVLVGALSGLAGVLLKTVVHWAGQQVMSLGNFNSQFSIVNFQFSKVIVVLILDLLLELGAVEFGVEGH